MARLVFRTGPYAGKSLTIPAGKDIVAGRNRDIDLPLPDLKLSRKHCQFSFENGTYYISDLGSTNGTFVNGERIVQKTRLSHFDRLAVGDLEIEFQIPEGIEDEATHVGMPAPLGGAGSALAPAEEDKGLGIAEVPVELPGGLEDAWQAAEAPVEVPVEIPTEISQEALEEIPSEIAAQELAPVRAENEILSQALNELDQPLPDIPEPLPGSEQNRPSLFFCDTCDGSIPMLDLDLHEAKELGGKMICKDCLAKGVAVNPEPPPRPIKPSAKGEDLGSSQDIDEILKGLGEEEEIELSDLPGNRSDQEVGDPPLRIPGGPTRRQKASEPESRQLRKGPPPPPISEEEIQDLLGDDFEEIDVGDDLLANLESPPDKNKKAAIGKKQESLFWDEDQDLIEIG